MALKKTLYCIHCGRKTLHEEISYTEAVQYVPGKKFFLTAAAVFVDYYPFAKVTLRALGYAEAFMQCTSCGCILNGDD
jgi:hypothetical protein